MPIIGVAKSGWTLERPEERAPRTACRTLRRLDPEGFPNLMSVLRYVDGDYADPEPFASCAQLWERRSIRCIISPFLPALLAKSWNNYRRWTTERGARVVAEKPFGRDLASAQALNRTLLVCVRRR